MYLDHILKYTFNLKVVKSSLPNVLKSKLRKLFRSINAKIITNFNESQLRLNEHIDFLFHKESAIRFLNVDFFYYLKSFLLSGCYGLLISFGLARLFNFNGLSNLDIHYLLNRNWLDEVFLLHNHILLNQTLLKIKFLSLALNHLVQKYLI